MSKIVIPNGAQHILTTLFQAGYEAYVVGGCVRDSLLGITPHDWDICTNATPEEVEQCFAADPIFTTKNGLKHGTVVISTQGELFEVTTFRVDGDYSDHRHPDTVSFTSKLENDLARRDFTVNAMAYNDVRGLIDPFHGERDLKRKRIACVGDPALRFQEDALRIMRAMRFASTYAFSVDEDTANAMHIYAQNLNAISAERIRDELCKLLLGKNVLSILLEFKGVLATVIPELAPCIGFDQNNRYHQYTVYDHIAHAVANYTGDDVAVKMALLIHDIGKPLCYTVDERGGHFHGHAVPSCELTKVITKRLRFSNKLQVEIITLVEKHDAPIEPTPKSVRRWLNVLGPELFMKLLDVRMADIQAHAEGTQEPRIEKCNAARAMLEEQLAKDACFSMKDLMIRGTDIISMGVPEGMIVGEILHFLLRKVIDGTIPNDHNALMESAWETIATLNNH